MNNEIGQNQIIARYYEMLLDLTSAKQFRFKGSLEYELPKSGGVYRISRLDGTWKDSLFVGRTENLYRRIFRNHFTGTKSSSILITKLLRLEQHTNELELMQYFRKSLLVQFIEVKDARLRSLFEHFAIAILQPIYND